MFWGLILCLFSTKSSILPVIILVINVDGITIAIAIKNFQKIANEVKDNKIILKNKIAMGNEKFNDLRFKILNFIKIIFIVSPTKNIEIGTKIIIFWLWISWLLKSLVANNQIINSGKTILAAI
ncbi:hypothetical protein EG856_01160 [Mycoplasmopsis phocirhinis]|uniref:Uncharacterized protein n=1 Tax=Mycoplasmopsis phocirhinis TaxID=142650 RepID=A0A4P6MQH1_9BACT|nr:hypothetical protein EG856_01160 [Mycoplasmopsis phocirhinis]